MEWAPVYHIRGWGKFNRHYGDFCIGADNWDERAPKDASYYSMRRPGEGLDHRVIPCIWRATARFLGFDRAMAGKNWRGALLEANTVAETVRTAGGVNMQVMRKHTSMAWCRGRKSDRAA